MTQVMRRDSKLAVTYAVVVAIMTLLYVGYENLGFTNHAAANAAGAQVDADDE
jgi:hypothetical protein